MGKYCTKTTGLSSSKIYIDMIERGGMCFALQLWKKFMTWIMSTEGWYGLNQLEDNMESS